MQEPKTIKPEELLPNHQNYDFLKRVGIRYAQELSGDIWTDYNEHDPGVTILEQLCYALTELGFKTDYGIESLIKDAFKTKGEHTFFKPQDIFPCHPLTLNDYRRLIIYNILEVKNAWVEISTENLQGVRGLYKVLLQLDESAKDEEQIKIVKTKVLNLLNENRNLCDDFEKIEILNVHKLKVSAKIDINPAVLGEEILANLIFQITNFLNPSIQLYTLDSLIEKGVSLNNIFNGPIPKNGFILEEDLRPIVSEIHISRISKIISGTSGVIGLKNLQVYKDGLPVYGDLILLEENHYSILDIDLDLSDGKPFLIQIFRSKLPYTIDFSAVKHILNTLEVETGGTYASEIQVDHSFSNNILPVKEFESYFSIQSQFPHIYNIGPNGVPPRSTPQKRAAAKQLKAYLLFFEQIIANYLSQLANIQQLFSLKPGLKTTYFSQVPIDVPNLKTVLKDVKTFKNELYHLLNDDSNFDSRRNKFLDHLLARFNETFTTERLLQTYKTSFPPSKFSDFKTQLLNSKIDFLKDYVHLSRDRGKGFNYKSKETDFSGLKERICRLLNLNLDISSFVRNIQNSKLNLREKDRENIDIENKTIEYPNEDKIVAYRSFEKSSAKPTYTSLKETILEDIISQGVFVRNYDIHKGKKDFVVLFNSERTGENVEIFRAKKQCSAEKKVTKIIDYLVQLSEKSKGFFLIEHVLLRPLSEIKYGLNLTDDNNQVLLIQYKYTELEDQKFIANDLFLTGTIKTNYKVETTNDGHYVIILNDNYQKPIAKSKAVFIDEEKAEEQITIIVEYLNKMKAEAEDILSKVQFPPQEQKIVDTEGDPYSFKVSIILPNWPALFQNEEFKQLFYEVVQQNLPAHIGVDYYWLSYTELQEFEPIYFEWLSEKQKEELDSLKLDNLSFDILNFLTSKNK